MLRAQRLFLIVLLSVVGLPGCVYRWKSREYPVLKTYATEEDNVHVMVKPLTPKESKKQFGGNVLSHGYYALQLMIENNNGYYYILHPKYFGLPLVSPKKVAEELHANTLFVVSSMIGVGIFGLAFIYPLSYVAWATLPVGAWLSTNNDAITQEVMRDSINRDLENVVISPYGNMKCYVFVAEHNFSPTFDLMLRSCKDNKPVRFAVSLAPQKPLMKKPELAQKP